jgi:hypothetical protein
MHDPETFEILATAEDIRLKKSPPPPEVEERLRPYILLHDLQLGARGVVDFRTVRCIQEEPDVYRPLLRGVLVEWARSPDEVTIEMACLSAALLGEIGDRATLEELLELSQHDDLFLHVNWAIYRFAERLPQETLEVFRAAIPTASLGLRCTMADQMGLMEPTPGLPDLLETLVNDLSGDHDASAYLLMSVTTALKEHGEDTRARAVIERCEPKLSEEAAEIRRTTLESKFGFVSALVAEGIEGLEIDHVVLERALFDEDDDEEDDEFEDDEFDDSEFDHAPVVAPPKPGRNDPCWCGSGKKYKKCHLAEDEKTDGTGTPELPEGAAKVPLSVIPRLIESSDRYNSKAESMEAMKLYFGDEPPHFEDGLFLEWMLFAYRNPRTRLTALERFAKEESRGLTAREREFVESLRRARFGLYEVQSVERDHGVNLKDLCTGEEYFVHDVSSSRAMVAWDCMLTRLHDFEGDTLFVGNGSGVPRDLLPDLQKWIAGKSRAAGQSEADFVAANSHRMHRVVMDLHESRLKNLRIVTAEGDDMEFSHGHYEVLDQALLLEALRAQPDLVEQTEKDGGGEYHFGWLEGPARDEGTRSLGHIFVRGGRVRLETTSRPRLKKGRRMLEKIAKRAIKHLGDSIETPQQAMERTRTEPPAANEKPPVPLPPEVEREVIERVKAEHYAKWPDESLPALGGKTARQAVQTPEGRKAVEDLLRMMENREAREGREGQPVYDFTIVRRELGLT